MGYLIPVCFLAFVGSGGGKATFVIGLHVLGMRITAWRLFDFIYFYP